MSLKSLVIAVAVAAGVAGAYAGVLAAEPAESAVKVEKGFKPLFNGRDLAGWHLRRSDAKNGWSVKDGVLVNVPPSGDLVSDKEYLNFELRYDYRVYANSGVGLRGRYEIQIDDSYGKAPESHGNGAIYSQLAPSKNVSKPKGEWQSIQATLVGSRITVVHNGVKTVDNYELKAPTGIQYGDKLEHEAGPIILQGDHGAVDFRNIRIKELPGSL
jgi:hypothetical protein